MAESFKGLSYIDILDNGEIYIEAGNEDTPITRLGREGKKFRPYVEKIGDDVVMYVYRMVEGYIPPKFKTPDEFMMALDQQSISNEYIQNYVKLAGENLRDFLSSSGVLDSDTIFVKINSGSNITDILFNVLTEGKGGSLSNAIYTNDDFATEDLSITDKAPESVKNKLNDLLYQTTRIDRNYSFEDLDLETKYLQYLDGFLDIRTDIFRKINNGTSVILMSNYLSSSPLLKEAIRRLQDMNITVLSSVVLAKKN